RRTRLQFGDRTVPEVKSQVGCPLSLVGAVTCEAIVRENSPDVAVEFDRFCGIQRDLAGTMSHQHGAENQEPPHSTTTTENAVPIALIPEDAIPSYRSHQNQLTSHQIGKRGRADRTPLPPACANGFGQTSSTGVSR